MRGGSHRAEVAPGATGVVVESNSLRRAGLKVTLPRMKILEVLEASEQRHVSAEAVYRALLDGGEDIGLATVYRVLTQFETAGIVERHNFQGSHSVFELNDSRHHDHMVCTGCGRVEEFVDDTIEKRQQEVASERGFRMNGHSLVLYGLCAACAQADAPDGSSQGGVQSPAETADSAR